MGRVCPRIGPRGHGPTTESLANSKDKPWPLCQHSVPRFSPWAVEQCWGLGRQHSNCALPHRKLHSLPQVGQDRPWGTAGCLCTARRGYASACCLRRWLYEGISRQKAEELLLQPGNRSGSFLIRESQTRQGCYSLSVRRSERASWDSVTHYRIHRLENGWVYISPGLTFPSLHDLVDHYSEFGEGLCCALREPCSMEGARAAPVPAMPAVVKKPSLNWDKIDRGHSPTGGGLSHQPGPEGSHQLLPPGDRDRALQGKERIAKGRALLSHSPSAALVTATNTCGCCGSQAPRGQ
ncbi:src-like-adapter 2 isoform X3 [Falco peregrinus]|uniref:src-like-adapter 2 isoform X3 n=1 Tax=Falco peregrinus TaxID=8954 RepID=UPI00247A1B7C|nr:src-like-adapter 2 isoform X3 [Falco peregrinus]